MNGHAVSRQVRNKISKGNSGKIRTYEMREKYSKAKKGILKYDKIKKHGYWWIYMPEHHRAVEIYVKRAILITEKYTNRLLKDGEVVHHINNIKDDDRPENLYICKNASEHAKIRGKNITTNLFKSSKNCLQET